MNEYVRYRNWWRKWVYDKAQDPGPFNACFEAHINAMSLYKLMETLEGFGEEDNDEYAPGSQPEKMMEEWGKELDKFRDPNPPYIKYPTPSNPNPVFPPPFTPNPWPGVRSCSRCGISLEGVMGYVCTDQACPTFRHVWSGTITGTITSGGTGPYFGGSSNLSKEEK